MAELPATINTTPRKRKRKRSRMCEKSILVRVLQSRGVRGWELVYCAVNHWIVNVGTKAAPIPQRLGLNFREALEFLCNGHLDFLGVSPDLQN